MGQLSTCRHCFFVSLVIDQKPASALVCSPNSCYTFNNAISTDTSGQNEGTATILGSFKIPSGTSVATATQALITLSVSNRATTGPGAAGNIINSPPVWTFDRAFQTTIGRNLALILYCSGVDVTCTIPPGGSSNNPTYQMALGFGVDFVNGPFPANISLAGLNLGNINQLCTSLNPTNLGTNSCNNGENNRMELAFAQGSTLAIPMPLSGLAVSPFLFLATLRKRYLRNH